MKKLLFIIYLCSIISCQKKSIVEPEQQKCFITKISETARNSQYSNSQKAIIEYDNQQRVSKVTNPNGDQSYLTYSYEKGKIIIKTFSRDDLQYTRSLILNDKNQVIQELVKSSNKVESVNYTYNAQGFLSNASFEESGFPQEMELKYEYNNDGSPSKITTILEIFNFGAKYSYYTNYEYDNNVAFTSMPNTNELYSKFIHKNFESLFTKVVKSSKTYSIDNELLGERSLKYLIGNVSKKVERITIDSYGTLNGVRDESSLVNNVQEFEYLCK